MNWKGLFVFALLGQSVLMGENDTKNNRPELDLKRIYFVQPAARNAAPYELSGLIFANGKYYTVSDDPSHKYIYEIRMTRTNPVRLDEKRTIQVGRMGLTQSIDLTRSFKDSRNDFEGIAFYNNRFYLTDERAKRVVSVNSNGTGFREERFAWGNILKEGSNNAQLEAITIDAKSRTLYLVKERDPRKLIRITNFDRRNRQVTAHNVAGSDRQGQRVINLFDPRQTRLLNLSADLSGLDEEGDYLYALERNTYEIAKIRKRDLAVVKRVSYYDWERRVPLGSNKGYLYQTGEPFGTAEGLVLTEDHIVIAFDNNGAPLTDLASRRFGVRGNLGCLMFFERPENF